MTYPDAPPPQNNGSLLLGFLLAWGCLIAGYFVSFCIMAASGPALYEMADGGGLVGLLWALPWLGMIGLIVWFAANNQGRSALGVLLGLGSMVGIALLLVATCFVLLSGTNFH